MTDPVTTNIVDNTFQVPAIATDPMYQKVQPLTIDVLTSGAVNGGGAFDKLMSSMGAQLQHEADNGRITGNEYTKAYIAMVQAALQTALQFVLGKDQAFWVAQQSQIQAIDSRIKLEASRYEFLAAQFNYDNMLPSQKALVDAQKDQVVAETAVSGYNLNNILPAQLALTNAQKTSQDKQNSILDFQLSTILPGQSDLTIAQKVGQDDQNAILAYQLATVLPSQVSLTNSQKTGQDNTNANLAFQLSDILPMQSKLVREQMESARAMTSNSRSTGEAQQGTAAAQRDLYAQQVISYQRDAEVKAGKLFTDAWITMKTIDEGITSPDGFTNASVDLVLTTIKNSNGFVATP